MSLTIQRKRELYAMAPPFRVILLPSISYDRRRDLLCDECERHKTAMKSWADACGSVRGTAASAEGQPLAGPGGTAAATPAHRPRALNYPTTALRSIPRDPPNNIYYILQRFDRDKNKSPVNSGRRSMKSNREGTYFQF